MSNYKKEILNIIDTKIEDYNNIISELENSKNPKDNEILTLKYNHGLLCLTELRGEIYKKFFFEEDIILTMLKENYEKHDLLITFVDGSQYTIPGKWDKAVSVKDNTICIHEPIKDPSIIPPILELFNIENIVSIKRAD